MANHKLSKTRILQCALGASFLVLLSLAAQHYASAQPAAGVAPGTPSAQGQNPNGMHIYLWAGLKSHGEGQHDYPQFLADWSKLLTAHGAVVDGAVHAPSAADLEHTDVVVVYKGDAAYLTDAEKAVLEAYVKRGGGIVSFHDSLCGPDPQYFATTFTGGAKKHGETNFTLDSPMLYTVTDKESPIMADFAAMGVGPDRKPRSLFDNGIDLILPDDEAFFSMTWAKDPAVHVLATVSVAGTNSAGTHKGEAAPQMWTYEHTLPGGSPARAFVWMQGHTYTDFTNPHIEKTLLRGIAWAGKKPVEELTPLYTAPGRGGRGGSGGRGFSGGRGAGFGEGRGN